MYKGSDLMGKPIVTMSDGEMIETVRDIVFDSQSKQVLALLVDEGGLMHSARIVPFEEIKAIGPDAITVDNKEVVIEASKHHKVEQILNTHKSAKGLKVMTDTGENLGTISDMYFNELTGGLEGYEVSGGMFADAYTGRSFLPAPKTLKLGEDVAFVPAETAQMMEEQVGGLKRVGMNAQQKASELTEQAKLKAAETQAKTIEMAKGRRAQQDLRADDGRILVAQGQIVDEKMIEEARREGKERQLLVATAVASKEEMKLKANEFASTASQQLKQGAGQTKDALEDVWTQLKAKAAVLKDQTSQQVEEKRIRGALGRPVNRVILDQNDEIILKTGDMITHQAIEKARAADALDILLSSVHTETPKLSQDDIKTPTM